MEDVVVGFGETDSISLPRQNARPRDVPRLLLHRVPTVSRTSAVDFVDAYLQHEGRASEICSSSIRIFLNDKPGQSMTQLDAIGGQSQRLNSHVCLDNYTVHHCFQEWFCSMTLCRIMVLRCHPQT